MPLARVVAMAALVMVAATACSFSGSGSSGSGTTEPSVAPSAPASPTSSASPTASGTPAASPTVPAGWTAERQDDLVFALPPGFTARPEGAGMPGASAQWTKADDATLPIPPAVAVFVETGAVGPLGVRADLLRHSRKAVLGADPIGPAREVPVPGSTGAVQLEWSWGYAFLAGKPPVPSRQVELLVQTGGQRQYGLLLGGPSTYLSDQVLADFLASVAVVPVQDGA